MEFLKLQYHWSFDFNVCGSQGCLAFEGFISKRQMNITCQIKLLLGWWESLDRSWGIYSLPFPSLRLTFLVCKTGSCLSAQYRYWVCLQTTTANLFAASDGYVLNREDDLRNPIVGKAWRAESQWKTDPAEEHIQQQAGVQSHLV